MNTFFDKLTDERGIAILYAVVVSAVVIMLGASITSIINRQQQLVKTSAASTRAFTSADTALECTMYHDELTGTSTFMTGAINCAGTSASVSGPAGGGQGMYTFQLNGDEVCAVVRVQKNSTTPYSNVEARGFNTCEDDPDRAERALRSSYN